MITENETERYARLIEDHLRDIGSGWMSDVEMEDVLTHMRALQTALNAAYCERDEARALLNETAYGTAYLLSERENERLRQAIEDAYAVGMPDPHATILRIRAIFRDAFAGAGLPYFNPHSFRNTLVRLGQAVCQTPEEFKAWSQNLGHEKVLTTFLSYGEVENIRQGEIIREFASKKSGKMPEIEALAKAVAREIRASEAM